MCIPQIPRGHICFYFISLPILTLAIPNCLGFGINGKAVFLIIVLDTIFLPNW